MSTHVSLVFRSSLWMRWSLRLLLGALLVGFFPRPSDAVIRGQTPQVLKTFKVFGSAISTGNTMMSASPPGNVNDILLPQNAADVRGVPFDGKLVGAYLWWTGTVDGTPDTDVDFTLANGTKVTATADGPCQVIRQVFPNLDFFYCRKDVTQLLQQQGGGLLNGTYVVGGLRALPGNCAQNAFCQANYGAWSLVVVWESPTAQIRRDIVLYDSFLLMDEQQNPPSSGITSFRISGFQVGNPPEGNFTYFGMEGDEFLGSPPEAASNGDFISFRAQSATQGTRLQSPTPYNPPGNVWNSSLALGVDIDTFNIGRSGLNLLRSGDTFADIVMGAGDGVACADFAQCGDGELVFLGYVLLSIDTLTPNFRNKDTLKQVDKPNASVNDTLTYTLKINNNGSLEAKNVIVRDAIPASTTYVPNSTKIDGKAVPDVGGTSPLVSGLNLGTIAFQGDTDRDVTFQVRITSVPATRRIENFFTVQSDEVGPFQSNTVVTTIQAPQLGEFSKTFAIFDTLGNPTNRREARPGEIIRYTIVGRNNGSAPAPSVQFTDDLPKFVKLRPASIILPAGTSPQDNFSTSTGGANGTGRIEIRNITIPAQFTTQIIYEVQIFSEAEFATAGVTLDKIDGTRLSNQGEARQPLIPTPLKTDDPTTPPKDDPTIVTLSYKPDFSASTKGVRDDNGGRPEPGDKLTYTVTFNNKGSRDTTVRWEDAIPGGVTNFQQVSSPPGSQVQFQPPPAGGNQNGLLTVTGISLPTGATVQLVFTVDIAQNATNGLAITNIGTIIDQRDDSRQTISSPTLIVVAGPILNLSTKTVADTNGGQIQPGDILTYTLTVRNSGNRPALDVEVTDPIDTNLDTVTPAQGGTFAANTITWNKTTTPALASIAPNATVVLTFTARIKLGTADGTLISNQGTMRTPGLPSPERTDDPGTPPAGDPTVVRVVSRPQITVSKTVTDTNGAPAQPGDSLRYTILLQNSGTAAATDVSVSDPIDPSLANATPDNGGRLAGGSIVWDRTTTPSLASVAPGATVTLSFTAQIATPLANGTVISNQATVRGTNLTGDTLSNDPATPAPNDPTRLTVQSAAQVTFTKEVRDLNGGDVVPGDTLLYTLTLKVAGNAPLTEAIITDAVPAQLTQIQPAQNGRLAGQTITWDSTALPALRNVAPGATITVTFTAVVQANLPDGTVISNQGSLQAKDSPATLSDDPSTPAPADPTRVTVRSRPDLSVSTKTVADTNGGQILPGDTLSYTITIRNTGNVAATGVTVTDAIDANLEQITPGQGGRFAAGTITWDPTTTPALASVASGSDVQLTFTARIKSPLTNGTKIPNQGRITATNLAQPSLTDDPSTPAASDPTIVTVVSGPVLSETTKEVNDNNGGQPEPSDILTYTIKVKNTGTDVARNVRVTDKVDLTKLSQIQPGQGGRLAGDTITWDATSTPALASLAIGGEVSLTFTATILPQLANGTVIDNQAQITSTEVTTPVLSDDPRTIDKGDPTRITVVAGASLSDSTKAVADANGGSVQPGDTLTYTITIRNTGKGAAEQVVVTDKVDITKLVNVQPGQGGSLAGDTITWDATSTPALRSLAPNASTTVTFTAQVAPGLLAGTLISNQGFLTARDLQTPVPTDDPATPALDDPTNVTVGGQPTLAATKTFTDNNGGDPEPGDTIAYTIVVRNTGNRAASNVVISDTIDPNLETITPADGGVFDAATRRILWTLPSIAPAASATVRFTAQIKAGLPNNTSIPNQAQVTSAEVVTPVLSDDPGTPAALDPTIVLVKSTLRIRFVKAARDLNGGSWRPGDRVEYSVTLQNQGTASLARLTVTDVVDARLEQIQVANGGTLAGNTVTWTFATTPDLVELRAGATVTLTFTAAIRASVRDGEQIPNQAEVRAEGAAFTLLSDDPATPAANDPTVILVAFPDLSTSTKEVRDINGGTLEPGDEIEYTIKVKNTGTSPINNVVVTDVIDTNLEQIAPDQGGRLVGQTITWDSTTTPGLGTLPGRGEVVLAVRARVKAATPDLTVIRNQGQMTGREINTPVLTDDPSTPAPADPTLITVRRAPNLASLTKTVSGDTNRQVNPGGQLTYTIKVKNTGSRPATQVEIRDTLDPLLTSATPANGGVVVNGEIVWNIPTIAPNQEITVTFTATVSRQAQDGAVIDNQARVKSSEIPQEQKSDDPSTPQAGDPTRVTVLARALLLAAKTVVDDNGADVQAGDILTYTIRITNRSPSQVSQVILVDATPPNTEYIAGSSTLNGQAIPDDGFNNPFGAGVLVRSARSGTQPGIVLPDDALPPEDEAATATFKVRVRQGTPNGTRIANQGRVSGTGLDPILTDDPATPSPNDATVVIVGGGPDLSATVKTVRIAEDRGTPNVADIGDVLEYSIIVRNTGRAAAQNVVFQDPTPTNSTYIPGSITLNGQAQTDRAGDDASEFNAGVGTNGTIFVRSASLAPAQNLTITFRVRIDGGTEISNQGFVEASNFSREATDADDNDANGNQPTVIPVGRSSALVAVKEVIDLNGDEVSPGDILEYRITVRNNGLVDVTNIELTDAIPANTTYQTNSLQGPGTTSFDAATRTITVRGFSLSPGQSALIVFQVVVAPSTAEGTVISNTASVKAQDIDIKSNEVRSTVRRSSLRASLQGLIFQDFGADDTAYDAADDEILPGFLVRIYRPDNLQQPVQTATADTQGLYRMDNLPTGQYKLRYFSEKDVQYGELDLDLRQGGRVTQNIIVSPTGRLYQSEDGTLIEDARVYLVYDDLDSTVCRRDDECGQNGLCIREKPGDREGRCGQKVRDEDLLLRQQGQPSTSKGMYKFNPPVAQRRYRIAIRPANPRLVFPSLKTPAETGIADYGTFADNGKVVAPDRPDIRQTNQPKTYYTRFSVATADRVVQNNHLPLDTFETLIILTKQASAQTATIGDIITYTLKVENRSPVDLLYDPNRKVGGIFLSDALPNGFRLLPLSPRVRRSDGREVLAEAGTNRRDGQSITPKRLMRFGPFDLPGQTDLVLRYQTVIPRGLPIGSYVNIAYVHNEAGAALSEKAQAVVRVTYDPIFDQGTVIGKVFCDKNENRWQDLGDKGIAGARIYLDNGHYTESDVNGKFHIQAIDPGNHMIKLDIQTLPPGSTMIDSPERVFYVSRGLFRKINFAVRCTTLSVNVQKVFLKTKILPPQPIKITGSVYGPRMEINGTPRMMPVVAMVVTKKDQFPDFLQEQGPDFLLKDGRLATPIAFHLRIAPGVRPADWRLDIYKKSSSNKADKQMNLLMRSLKGVGAPPPTIEWDGTSALNQLVLTSGELYFAQFTLHTQDKEISQSAPRLFGLQYTKAEPKSLWTQTYPASWMGRSGVGVYGRLRSTLRSSRKALAELLQKPDAKLQIHVHHNDSLPRQRSLFLTVRRAAAIGRELQKLLKLPADRIETRGFGSSKPMLPNISRRNREKNLRIVITVVQNEILPDFPLAPLKYEATVQIGKLGIPINDRGLFEHIVKPPIKPDTHVQIRTTQGAVVELPLVKKETLEKPGAEPPQPRPSMTPASPTSPRPATSFLWRGRRHVRDAKPRVILHPSVLFQDKKLQFNFRDQAQTSALDGEAPEQQPSFRLTLADTHPLSSASSRRLAQAPAPRSGDLRPAPDATKAAPPASGGYTTTPSSVAPSVGSSVPAAPSAPSTPTAAINPIPAAALPNSALKKIDPKADPKAASKLDPKAKDKKDGPKIKMVEIPLAQAQNINASILKVTLPPQGAVISKESIRLQGITHPTNKLTINGQAIKLTKSGEFDADVKVKHGQQILDIVAEDTLGNRGEIKWPVKVNLNRLFLLALADITFGQQATPLEGIESIASAAGSGVLFHGRAVLYAKGQIQGKHILSALFKKIEYTAYLETPKRREAEEFYQQLIDPEKYYPVYGDASRQVQDVTARGFGFSANGLNYRFPVYAMVQADRSKVLVGNFRTAMRGLEVARYDRTFYGVDIDFQKRFAKHFDTRARVFVSDGEQQQLKAHVQIRGTGGSLYYLKHSEIIEGTEQIRLTIRDKDSGIILQQIPLTRYDHYNIQYFDGRIFFKHPVSSVVDSFLITQHNLYSTLDGNPVTIEADYEYRNLAGQNGVTVGVQVSQSFYDKIKVGFNFVHEGRADSTIAAYQLYSADLELRWNQHTYLQAEYARSVSFDSQSYFSNDGGLTFNPLQGFHKSLDVTKPATPLTPGQPGSGTLAPVEGNAFALRVNSDVGDVFKWKNVGLVAMSYFAFRDQSFFSAGQAPEQGSLKGGITAKMTLFKKHQIQLKYDGAKALRFDPISSQTFDYEKHLVNLQYAWSINENWDVVVEYSHTDDFDSLRNLRLYGNFISLGGTWKVNKYLQVLLRQQFAFDTVSLAPLTFMDHYATTLGVNLRVFDTDTFLSAAGTVRWSGNNSVQVGLKSQMSPETSAYIREQLTFTQQSTGLVNTLVLGAERQIGNNSKVYGEYQMDNGMNAETGRAVVGLSHTIPVIKGLLLGLGLERSQFLDFLNGSTSRTVGRVSFELTRFKQVKASARYEVRFDDGDERAGSSDRLQFVTMNNLAWEFTPDLSFLARVNYAITHNYGFDKGRGGKEGELLEFSLGLAYRPVHFDWVNAILKYTQRRELRPVLLNDDRYQHATTEVISLVPMFELPFRLQIVEQIAAKFRHEDVAGLQPASSVVVLWINRLNFHLIKNLDIGLEYRLMWSWMASGGEALRFSTFDHGLLVEVAYNVHRFFYVGVGYNFTKFTDNLFAEENRDYSGFFIRAVGKF